MVVRNPTKNRRGETPGRRERERRLVRPWRFAIINCSVLGTSKETKCARCLSLRYLSVPAAGEDPWTRFQWTFLNGRRCPLANIIPLHLRESRVPLTIASRLSPPRLILCRASGRTRVLLSLNSICASLNAAPFAIIHARTSVWGGRNGAEKGLARESMRDDEAARLIIAASNYIRPPPRGGCHNMAGKLIDAICAPPPRWNYVASRASNNYPDPCWLCLRILATLRINPTDDTSSWAMTGFRRLLKLVRRYGCLRPFEGCLPCVER